MTDLDKVLEHMKQMENTLLTKLEKTIDEKITTITDTALQKVHMNITNNTAAINEIQNQLTLLKDDVSANTSSVNETIENINGTNKRVAKCENDLIPSDMRLQSIEDELGEKTYQMSYTVKRRIKSIENDIAVIKSKINLQENIV